jgi:LPS export ABC transporter protein LptC|tara:strand:+ start:437 stop:1009 length:573 start_codon:yes stop_codon:yes gene_type:complete
MNQLFHITKKSIATIMIVGMLFSCTNDSKKVRDFLAEKNLPIAVAKDAHHIYKDSGKITSKLTTSLLNDFSNRKKHPYNEFPEGIKIINFENNGKDSVTVFGDYALSYSKTSISELKGNVVVINHTDASRLETDQLFWDQKNKYFFTEKSFTLTKINDTVIGVGFESMENLKKYVAKKTVGNIVTNENEL